MRSRFVLIVIVVVLVVAAIGFLSSEATRRSQFTTRLSTFSAAPEGGRALYALAERLHLKPGRVTHNLEVIPERGTLVSIAPRASGGSLLSFLFVESAFTEKEVEAIRRWVEQGNTFVLVAETEPELIKAFALSGYQGARWWETLGEELDEEDLPGGRRGSDEAREASRTWPPETVLGTPTVAARGVFSGVQTVEVGRMAPEVRLTSFNTGNETATDDVRGYAPLLVTADGAVVAAQVRVGAGRFVVVRSTWPATNAGLSREDNAVMLTQLIGGHAGSDDAEAGLWFDEYHHGFANDRSLAGYLRDSSLWVVVCQLGFLLLVIGWRVQQRFGFPLPLYEDEMRGSGDYLKAMSHIYRRGGHASHAIAVLLDDLDRRLVDHHRLRPGLAGDALVRALDNDGHTVVAKRHAALRAEAAALLAGRRVRDGALIELTSKIATFTESMTGGRV
jgi:hypothetical protein